MKLKVDAQGNAVVQDGFPVWIADDGKEIAYNVPDLVANMSRVNGESAGRRKEIDALTEQLKAFDGLDPAKAKSALETLANIDAGKLVDAGKVEELKRSIGQSYEAKINDLEKARSTDVESMNTKLKAKDESIRNLLVKGAFESSAYLRENTVLPSDLAYQSFGKHFEVKEENGALSIHASFDGKPIFSRANPGTPATTEEAIEAIIENYPMKERIVRAPQGGSGTQHPQGQGSGGGKSLSRSAFDAMPPTDKAKFMKDGGTLTD